MNIFQKMQDERNNFTKSERKICDYIHSNPQIVEKLTISRIADFAESSKSAVLRFCQKLGFSGYSEFKYELIRCLHHDTAQAAQDENTLLSSYTDVFSRSVQEMASLSQETLVQVAQWIQDAPVIRVMGISKSSLPVSKFFYDFTSLGKNVFRITDNITPGLVTGLKSDDLVIVFSVNGRMSSSSMRDFVDSAHELNCRIVLVTANDQSELHDKATVSLLLPVIRLNNATLIDNHALMIILVDIIEAYYINNF